MYWVKAINDQLDKNFSSLEDKLETRLNESIKKIDNLKEDIKKALFSELNNRIKYIKTEISTDIRSALDKAEQALKCAEQYKRESELLKNEFEIFKQSFKSVKKDCSSLQQQVCSTKWHSRRRIFFLPE